MLSEKLMFCSECPGIRPGEQTADGECEDLGPAERRETLLIRSWRKNPALINERNVCVLH